jgi:hypothetical protein
MTADDIQMLTRRLGPCRHVLTHAVLELVGVVDYIVVIEGDRESDPLCFAEIDTASAFHVFKLVVVAMR